MMNNIIPLAEQVARRLAGTPVTVRMRAPCRTDARAICHKSRGWYFIDIMPGAGEQAFLKSLLHEIAHIRLHGSTMLDVPDFPPARFSPSPNVLNLPGIQKMESEGENLASTWLDYAEQNAGKYSGTWLEMRLKALGAWFPEEMQELIDRNVSMGVQKVLNSRNK